VFLLTVSAEWQAAPARSEIDHIVIDPGHGGKDPGCHGKSAKEKHVALAVAIQVQKLFQKHLPEVKVSLTRSVDKFIPLHQRAAFANRQKADLFVSIHCNANKNKRASGSETFALGTHKTAANLEVMKNENSAILYEADYKSRYDGFDPKSEESHIFFMLHQTAHLKQSLNLAKKIEKYFQQVTQRTSRGIKQAGFLVLWKTTMPSVLCEIGFLTNPNEEKFLNSPEGQRHIAIAIYRAIKEYRSK
jgi:N-acetylmuramoyl-L-alanine amidase